jgi:hypothetical protein
MVFPGRTVVADWEKDSSGKILANTIISQVQIKIYEEYIS